jgi:survival of motor neuron-related-splicing factor 30
MFSFFFQIDYLKILPSDTEEQKLRKKKKLKALKQQVKGKESEIISNNKQASWQTFVKKSSSKRVKGSVSGKVLGRDSMFASPDEVDGKVGVTGSGKGTTDFEQRKRYKFT